MGSPLLLFGLPALGIYALTSHCLRKRPHLLHRPRQFPIRCRHVSHRGGSGERIENTLEAFSYAQSQGTNLLELDCHLTRDGVVVVSHDDNLERQTGRNVKISETNYEDLPLYKDRLEVTFSPGHYSHGSDRRIPRLEDVFQKFPGMPINIEIKENNDELIHKDRNMFASLLAVDSVHLAETSSMNVHTISRLHDSVAFVADLIHQYDRSHISIWASFEEEVLKKCCAANKEMPYIFSVKRGITILLLYYVGLLPFIPLKESFLEFFLPSIMNRTYFPVEKGYCGALLAKFTHRVTMRKKLFKHLEDRGIQVLLWVLNEEKDFEEAFRYGVTGVMTDYPSNLRKYLDRHPPLLNE